MNLVGEMVWQVLNLNDPAKANGGLGGLAAYLEPCGFNRQAFLDRYNRPDDHPASS
jgi:hypothetical protein